MKMIVLFIVSMFIGNLLADANVDKTTKNKSFLMTAPGTITGVIKNSDSIQQKQHKQSIAQQPINSYANPQPQKFIQDNYNFPQYGQLRGHPNPWLDRPAIRQRNNMNSGNNWQNFENPWDTSNLPSLAPNGYQNKPVPGASMREPAYGFYGDNYGSSSFYPQFPLPLDPNFGGPSSVGGFPYMDGLMPGLGNDNNGSSFLPFGMF
jgi:hypothetical protein